MVEVNPLAEDDTGTLIAADAKVGFDDNAAFRQAEIFSQRDFTQEDPREVPPPASTSDYGPLFSDEL